MTCPYMLTSAPPELPGLIAALVWIQFMSNPVASERICRFRPDTMPLVTEPESPAGLPIATTDSPRTTSSELPMTAAGKSLPSILITARSVLLSLPMTVAGYSVSSDMMTWKDFPLVRTWALVMM